MTIAAATAVAGIHQRRRWIGTTGAMCGCWLVPAVAGSGGPTSLDGAAATSTCASAAIASSTAARSLAGGGSATDSASAVMSSSIAAYSAAACGSVGQQPIELDGLLRRQRPSRSQRQQLVSLLVHHVVSITWRNLIKPSRTLVFAVPRAMPRRSAISTWVNPPK